MILKPKKSYQLYGSTSTIQTFKLQTSNTVWPSYPGMISIFIFEPVFKLVIANDALSIFERIVVFQETSSLFNQLVLTWWNSRGNWKKTTWMMLLAVQMVTNLLSETTTSTCERTNIRPHNAVLMVKNSLNIQAADIQSIELMVVGYSKMEITGQNIMVAKIAAQEMAVWSNSNPQHVLWRMKIEIVPGLKV